MEEEVGVVDGLPQFIGDLVADGAGIFTGGPDGIAEAVRVGVADGEELREVAAAGLFLRFWDWRGCGVVAGSPQPPAQARLRFLAEWDIQPWIRSSLEVNPGALLRHDEGADGLSLGGFQDPGMACEAVDAAFGGLGDFAAGVAL